MNGQECLSLLTYIGQYDPTMNPAQESDQLVKATAWAALLDGIELEESIDEVRDHYRQTEKHISPARIRQAVFDTKATKHRRQRRQDHNVDNSEHPPPADLLDRTNTCPTCNTRPGQPCQPRMPFGINHIDRNPTSRTKHDQHSAYETLEAEGRHGIICECCGKHTPVPA